MAKGSCFIDATDWRDVTVKSAKAMSFTDAPVAGVIDKVHALQYGLYQAAKQDRGRRFHALFDKLSRGDVLERAWRAVAVNGGAAGVDGVTIRDITDQVGVGVFLERLAGLLREGRYRPAPLRRVHIPKPGQPGKTRPLGIPVIADRVIMAAAKIVLEPIFEADFCPVSFGFRPGRSAIDALDSVRAGIGRGQRWVLDADVSDCFGQIDHNALMGLVEARVVDRSMLRLLRAWLKVGVLEHGSVTATVSGTPQGSLCAAVGQHRAQCSRSGMGTCGLACWHTRAIRRRFRCGVRDQATGRTRPTLGRHGVGHCRVAVASRQDQHP